MNFFGVDFFDSKGLLISTCPIHDGDNETAFNINANVGDKYCGRWFCNTKNCHDIHGGNIFGFVWSMLEKRKPTTFKDVINFLEDFCSGVKDPGEVKRDFYTEFLTKKKKESVLISRQVVRSRLKIPDWYYLDRKFSPEILDEFDVGFCDNPKAEMYNRSVFPVYDESDKYMIGCVGRTVCNDPIKWKNQSGFSKSNHLFNIGKALPEIKKTKSIILVEGQGDVMKMWQAGAKNVVGLFGSNLSDSQEFLIQKTGALRIYILMDNDESGVGQKARQKIEEKMENLFEVNHLYTETKDVGDMEIDEIKERVLSQL